MDARRKALDIIAEISGRDAGSLRPELDLVGDLGIDSPRALVLLMELEDVFDIEIGEDDISRFDTVGDILDYVGGLS